MSRLLSRRKPVCGVADGYVLRLAEALPDDLPCPNEPTVPVAFRCPNCGRGTRTVCTVHARAIAAGSLFCDLCHLAGEVAFLTAEPSEPTNAMEAS